MMKTDLHFNPYDEFYDDMHIKYYLMSAGYRIHLIRGVSRGTFFVFDCFDYMHTPYIKKFLCEKLLFGDREIGVITKYIKHKLLIK